MTYRVLIIRSCNGCKSSYENDGKKICSEYGREIKNYSIPAWCEESLLVTPENRDINELEVPPPPPPADLRDDKADDIKCLEIPAFLRRGND